MIFNDQVNLNSVVDNGDVVDNQELKRPLRYFSTSVRTDYLRFGNPNLQRFVFGGEGKGPSNTGASTTGGSETINGWVTHFGSFFFSGILPISSFVVRPHLKRKNLPYSNTSIVKIVQFLLPK